MESKQGDKESSPLEYYSAPISPLDRPIEPIVRLTRRVQVVVKVVRLIAIVVGIGLLFWGLWRLRDMIERLPTQ